METDSDHAVGGESFASLVENQHRLEALISSSFDAIIAIDADRKIIKFNRQAESLLGYSESEMLGQTVEQFHEDKAKARELNRIIQDSGEIDRSDIVLVHKDGSKIPVHLSAKPIRDGEGNILGQVGYLRDLRKIRLLETRLKILIDALGDISSASNSREIIERVVRSSLLAIPAAERGSIHFYDERSRELNLAISSFDYSRSSWESKQFQEGEGLAGWVFQQQQPVISRNTLVDDRYYRIDNPEIEPHRSMLCAPITGKRKKFGVISLGHSTKTEAFSAPDLELLTGCANQTALALENTEQMSEIKKEADELEFLRSISLKINAQTKTEDILTAIVEGGNKLLGTEMAVVHWRGDREEISRTVVAPEEMFTLMTKPRLEDGLTAKIFRTGNPVVIPNTFQDKRVNPLVREAGIQSLVGYPLELRGRVAGVLFFNSRQRQFFGEHETHLILQLLPLAAVAIENSYVIERHERAHRLSESLVRVSSTLASTHVLEEQMAALKQFMQVDLSAPMFFLGLYEEITDSIQLKINYSDHSDQDLFSIPIENQPGWTISSYVVKQQQPVLWYTEQKKLSVCKDLGINPLRIGEGCQTCLAFPLEVEENILGVMSIQSPEPFAWDEIEASTFHTLAHQASIAIRNTRLRQQVDKAHGTAISVAQMTALGNLKDTLDSIVTGVKDVLGCDIVSLYTYRQEKDQFDLQPAIAGKLRFPDEITRTGTVGRSATPYKIIGMDDLYVAEDTQNDEILGSPFAQRENVLSSVAAPLKMQDRWVGVLFINYCHEKHTFTREELDNIRLFSSQAAVAISNALLYEAGEKRRGVLKIIAEAGRTVTSSLELDEVFANLAHQAFNISGEKGDSASFATINLVEENQTVLVAAYPQLEGEAIRRENLAIIDLEAGINERIGIIGRAAKDRKPVLVKNVEDHPDFIRSNPHTRCELAVPIIYHDEVVGVINVEHEKIGGLDEDDLQDIQSLAAHAAVAIQNARIYQALQRKNQHQQALYDASKIINASIDREPNELLELLSEQMVSRIVPAAGAMNIRGAIHLYNPEKGELRLECTFPADVAKSLGNGLVRQLTPQTAGEIGITGRAVLEKKPQRVGNVTLDGDYLNLFADTRSKLCVPMLEGETVLGVLSLECDQLNGFDQDTEDALSTFAELSVIAIQNTQRYRELKETRATVGNITAVAWMGLVAGAWRHSIGNMATTISDLSLLAQMDLDKGETSEKIKARLNNIQGIVAEIQRVPMPPLSSEEGVEPVYICQLVSDRLNQFRQKERYKQINMGTDIKIDESSTVRASSEWLRRILDILIDNAGNAMKECKIKRISIVISPLNDGAEILISDTGRGIPDTLRPNLFKKPILKKIDEKGSGIGLFLANSIIQVYGGQLKIHSTGPDGTTMSVWLPLMK